MKFIREVVAFPKLRGCDETCTRRRYRYRYALFTRQATSLMMLALPVTSESLPKSVYRHRKADGSEGCFDGE